MICRCGYEAPNVSNAERDLPQSHTKGEHFAYVTGSTCKLLEITDRFHLTPKEAEVLAMKDGR